MTFAKAPQTSYVDFFLEFDPCVSDFDMDTSIICFTVFINPTPTPCVHYLGFVRK